MAENLESKVPCVNLQAVAERAAAAGAAYAGVLNQTDTYFAVSDRRLKLREISHGAPDGTSFAATELIDYERPDRVGARVSAYTREPVDDPAERAAALAAEYGLRGVVRKRRDLWLIDRTRIHLDRVIGLGEFVELETVADGAVGPGGARGRRHCARPRPVGVDAVVLHRPRRSRRRLPRQRFRHARIGPIGRATARRSGGLG